MLQRRRSPAALIGGTPSPMDAPAGTPGAFGTPGGPDPGAPARGSGSGGVVGVVGTGGHVPSLPIQVNALQALCRQLFGFRLAMTALAAPFALATAEAGLAAWLVGSAVLVTFMVSYVLMRDWERFGPVLLRHPSLLAVDMLFGALLLFTASPHSTLGIVCICTPLLAGLVYSWRGAGIFAALQIVLLAAAYAVDDLKADALGLLLMGLCALAGAVGGTLRGLLLRFGAASQALTETRARLAVTGAVEEERARLAREMHDSVAKTLHGLALHADGLAESADRMDPLTVKHQAEQVARAARRAAAESRELLSDLRRASSVDGSVDISAELAARTADFARRSGVNAEYRPLPGTPLPALPQAVARQLLTIATEAMENAHRHAEAGRVEVTTGIIGRQLRLSVFDDGRGLPPGTTLDGLKQAGHFGLLGMVERAMSIGARIRIGQGNRKSGTVVHVDFPLAALPATGTDGAPAPPRPAAAPPPPTGAPAATAGAEHPWPGVDHTWQAPRRTPQLPPDATSSHPSPHTP
ncbi:sensor histidine kinase [Streptomyces odontomachi]|uniref:sensor histidine kinase n=1 Tax=Streptomyces odontomachi TaxID=2944940 RepID=UPI00210D2835|nr:histidine kinase [Streptomyces sp. ODS25]